MRTAIGEIDGDSDDDELEVSDEDSDSGISLEEGTEQQNGPRAVATQQAAGAARSPESGGDSSEDDEDDEEVATAAALSKLTAVAAAASDTSDDLPGSAPDAGEASDPPSDDEASEGESGGPDDPELSGEQDGASSGASGEGRTAAAGPGANGRQAGGHGKEGSFYAQTPEGTSFSGRSFADLGLSRPLTKAVADLGFTAPTPIQAAVIPLALLGRDIVASAITGSGKTAAFALPVLERLLFRQRRVAATHVLVLAPTRELAAQGHSMVCQLARYTDVRAALAVGGLSLAQQAAELRTAPEIVVATPGRVIDHVLNTMAFDLDTLSALILDEADRLLELGFQDEVRRRCWCACVSPPRRPGSTVGAAAAPACSVRRVIVVGVR